MVIVIVALATSFLGFILFLGAWGKVWMEWEGGRVGSPGDPWFLKSEGAIRFGWLFKLVRCSHEGVNAIHTKRLVRVRGCVWKERSREKKTKRNNLPPFLPEVNFLGEKTDQEEKGRRWLWIFSRTTYKWISDDLSVFPGVKCPYTLSTFSISAFIVPCHRRLALVFHSLRLVPMGKHNRSASLFLSPLFYHTLGLLLFIQSNPKHSTVSLLGCCHVWFVMTIVILLLSMLSFLPSPHHTFLVHPLIDHPTHLRNSILWWPFMPGKENE